MCCDTFRQGGGGWRFAKTSVQRSDVSFQPRVHWVSSIAGSLASDTTWVSAPHRGGRSPSAVTSSRWRWTGRRHRPREEREVDRLQVRQVARPPAGAGAPGRAGHHDDQGAARTTPSSSPYCSPVRGAGPRWRRSAMSARRADSRLRRRSPRGTRMRRSCHLYGRDQVNSDVVSMFDLPKVRLPETSQASYAHKIPRRERRRS